MLNRLLADCMQGENSNSSENSGENPNQYVSPSAPMKLQQSKHPIENVDVANRGYGEPSSLETPELGDLASAQNDALPQNGLVRQGNFGFEGRVDSEENDNPSHYNVAEPNHAATPSAIELPSSSSGNALAQNRANVFNIPNIADTSNLSSGNLPSVNVSNIPNTANISNSSASLVEEGCP